MFDQLVLLASGGLCYAGPVSAALDYFKGIGFPAPPQINPAEYLLDLVNADFSPSNKGSGEHDRVTAIRLAWTAHTKEASQGPTNLPDQEGGTRETTRWGKQPFLLPVLLHRAWIKSHRDFVAYGVRVAMYLVSLAAGCMKVARLSRFYVGHAGTGDYDGYCLGSSECDRRIHPALHQRFGKWPFVQDMGR